MADPLRVRIPIDATIAEFERSAAEKYEAGFELLTLGHTGSGIYLLGYAAEMLLKAAYFRFIGLSENDVVSASRRQEARIDAQTLGITVSDEGFHSIEFWSLLLRLRRHADGRLFPSGFENELIAHASTLHLNWHFAMRYLPGTAYTVDNESMFESTSWFIANSLDLWR
jgi:hypothetical protein